MVESLNKISSEELIAFSEQLAENKDDPKTALQILKVLGRYTMTGDQLQVSKVGKNLTGVTENPELYGGNNDLVI